MFSLRPYCMEDIPSMVHYANSWKVARNLRDVFPHPYAEKDARDFVALCIQNEGKGQLCRAIDVGGQAVGTISLTVGGDVYRRSGELGYWLGEEFWGRGIMTAAVQRICREGFERFDLVRIYAEPFASNTASRRVLEKAGFTLEGVMRRGVYKDGQVLDYCMYALLRDEA